MSGETIRDVVIRIAIEQKAASLKVPGVVGAGGSGSGGGGGSGSGGIGGSSSIASTAANIDKSIAAGIRETEKELDALEKSLAKMERDAERAYENQVREATSAYSRIMREREKNAADAERKYDQEAQEALDAYSRIMRAREAATEKQTQLNKSIAAQRSAVMETYGAGAMAALQMAKGVAFITAANEEEAASMMKMIAAAQGYFDLAVGGIHVLKSMNDVYRQSAIFLELQAAAATHAAVSQGALTASTTAATGATVAAGTAAATTGGIMAGLATGVVAVGTAIAAAFTGPVLLGVAALAAVTGAALGVRAWNNETEKSEKKLTEEIERSASRRVAALSRYAQTNREISQFKVGRLETGDQSGLGEELRSIQEQTREYAKQANLIPQLYGGRRQSLATEQRILSIQEGHYANLRQQLAIHDQIKNALDEEMSASRSISQEFERQAQAEKDKYKSALQAVGAMSQADLARAKRIQEKVDRGETLNRHDEEFAARNPNLRSSAYARAQQEKRGEESGLVDKSAMTQARERANSTRAQENAAKDEIEAELKKNEDQSKQVADLFVRGLQAMRATQDRIVALESYIADIEKENEKRWFKKKID